MREEHTERLKQGFIKVVQKEKEFERQLQNQQREEQLMQQKLAEQQRQQQQQIMEVSLPAPCARRLPASCARVRPARGVYLRAVSRPARSVYLRAASDMRLRKLRSARTRDKVLRQSII